MLEKVLFVLSFGERYVVASVTYLGLALVLFSTIHEDKNVYAQNGSTGCTHEITVTNEDGTTYQETVSGCDEGQQCCGTSCIPSTDVCCEDETSGSANSCACCVSTTGGPSSISCQ
jgi:hypothetical protein